jgi:phospholipid-binding lipoprotein MlaA
MRGKNLLFVAAAAIALANASAVAEEAPADAGTTDVSDDAPGPEAADDSADSSANEDASNVSDPLEGFNRVMYKTNNVIDGVIVVPIAKSYRAVTTNGMRKGLRNFLANAGAPVTLVNDILQAKPRRAGETTLRFLINSTFGVGGLVDVAAKWGVTPHTEDFGQTLAVWGVGAGPYLYLPVFGPSNLRDGFGRGVDLATDPLFWIRTNPAELARYSRLGATVVSFREPYIEQVDDIKDTSLDPYASFRSFYMQAREREIRDGAEDFESLPDIGEYEELEEIE